MNDYKKTNNQERRIIKIQNVPINKIKIKRERLRDLSSSQSNPLLIALSESIREHGLLHPIIINSDFQLISGERRLMAVKLLGWKEVECKIIHVPEDKELEIELEENIVRLNLNPYQEYVALAKLKLSYEKKYPHSIRGKYERKRTITASDATMHEKIPSFISKYSKRLGYSERALSQKVRIGLAIINEQLPTNIINKIKENTITQKQIISFLKKKSRKIKNTHKNEQFLDKKSLDKGIKERNDMKIRKKKSFPSLIKKEKIKAEKDNEIKKYPLKNKAPKQLKVEEKNIGQESETRDSRNGETLIDKLREKKIILPVDSPSSSKQEEEVPIWEKKRACLDCSHPHATICPICLERILICKKKNSIPVLRTSYSPTCEFFKDSYDKGEDVSRRLRTNNMVEITTEVLENFIRACEKLNIKGISFNKRLEKLLHEILSRD